MKFKLFNSEVEIENVNYEESITSPHTGEKLEKIYFDLDIQGKSMNDIVQNEIFNIKNGGVFSLNEDGNNVKEYRLVKNPYSYSGSYTDEDTVYSYTLYLEEVERLNIDGLIIGDLEVFPYEYKEEHDEDKNAIIITAKVKLTKKESKILRNNDRYFKVIRKGISNKELEMRFGVPLWSEEENRIKERLIIVEKIYDENKSKSGSLFQPEMSNIQNKLAYTENLNAELINLLLSKEILTSDEVENIKEKAELDIKNTWYDFYKVQDIDNF